MRGAFIFPLIMIISLAVSAPLKHKGVHNKGFDSRRRQASIQWTPTITKSLGAALTAAVGAGDGGGVDGFFRNSGVVVKGDFYYAVNGVHPVNNGDYTSYYPKSVIQARISDDTIVTRYPFSEAFGHDIDMEGLSWGPDDGQNFLYIGDEYNYLYQMDLTSGALVREWNLNTDLGISTGTDRGVECLTYNPNDGRFYAGIQASARVYSFTIDPTCSGTACTATPVTSFAVAQSPSGLFYYPEQDSLYVLCGTNTNGDQFLYRYSVTGSLLCSITIPQSTTKFSRTDGFFIDGTFAYLADSQGPIHAASGSLGFNLYQVAWDDPCGAGGTTASETTTTSAAGTTTSSPATTSSAPTFCTSTVGISLLSLLLTNWAEPVEDLMALLALCDTNKK